MKESMRIYKEIEHLKHHIAQYEKAIDKLKESNENLEKIIEFENTKERINKEISKLEERRKGIKYMETYGTNFRKCFGRFGIQEHYSLRRKNV